MRWRLSKPAMTCMATVGVALLVNGSAAPAWCMPAAPVIAPHVPLTPSDELDAQPLSPWDGLDVRTRQATADAAKSGADIEVVVMDRDTGQIVSNGATQPFPIASVVKLFIADDLLLQESKGETKLSAADRKSLDIMLRSSDDGAAQTFWIAAPSFRAQEMVETSVEELRVQCFGVTRFSFSIGSLS